MRGEPAPVRPDSGDVMAAAPLVAAVRSIGDAVGLVIAILLTIFMIAALLFPERF